MYTGNEWFFSVLNWDRVKKEQTKGTKRRKEHETMCQKGPDEPHIQTNTCRTRRPETASKRQWMQFDILIRIGKRWPDRQVESQQADSG